MLKTEYRYKSGKKHGAMKMWYNNGQLQKESIYRNGEVMTYSYGLRHEKCWDNNGNEIECK